MRAEIRRLLSFERKKILTTHRADIKELPILATLVTAVPSSMALDYCIEHNYPVQNMSPELGELRDLNPTRFVLFAFP